MARKAYAQIKLIRAIAKRTDDPALRRLVRDIEEYQVALITPKNFDGDDPENFIKNLESSFEAICTSLEELGVHKPHELTVFQFYSKIQYFEKKKLKQKR